jgi:hypothetical protein
VIPVTNSLAALDADHRSNRAARQPNFDTIGRRLIGRVQSGNRLVERVGRYRGRRSALRSLLIHFDAQRREGAFYVAQQNIKLFSKRC